MSISLAARPIAAASGSSGRCEGADFPSSPAKVCVNRNHHSSKSGKATFAGVPFLADLVFDRQVGRCGGAMRSMLLIRRLRLVHVLDEVVDRCLLAHMPPLHPFQCFSNSDNSTDR